MSERIVSIDYSGLCPLLLAHRSKQEPIILEIKQNSEGEKKCNEGGKQVNVEVLENQTVNVRCWGCTHMSSGFKEVIAINKLPTVPKA